MLNVVRRISRTAFPVLGILILAGLAAVMLGHRGSNGEVESVAVERPTGPPQGSFALLRDPTREAMPTDVQRLLSNQDAPADSAKSIDLGFDRPAWALFNDKTVCIVVPETLRGRFAGYGSSCSPSVDAQERGVALTRYASENEMREGGKRAVFALVPDGVDAVRVTDRAGDTRPAPVNGNVVRLDGVVGDAVTFEGPDDQKRVLVEAAAPPAP